MQNDFLKKINVSTRIIVLLLIIISLTIAKSLYYIVFISILFVILFLLANKTVKYYTEVIVSVKFWLLFSLIMYIIVMKDVYDSIVFAYKFLLIILYVVQLYLTIKFEKLCNGIKTLLSIVKIGNDKVSYNIALTIYFIKFYIDSKKIIFKRYNIYQKILYTCSLKYNIFPRILVATKKSMELEFGLRIKSYTPQLENKNINSKIILFLSIIVFIVVVFKEVIL